MKRITKTFCLAIACMALFTAMHSCKSTSETSNSTKCSDSLATANAATTAVTSATTSDTATGGVGSTGGMTSNAKKEKESGKIMKNSAINKIAKMADETAGRGSLNVTSPAFGNGGVIPVKYTCDGSGVTPPINVNNIPSGTQSLTLIVHDYNATPGEGFTYWIIWNLDTLGSIPENFRNSHEGMNAAKQYGNTPLCAKSGNHKYHFIVYAVDCKLVIGKNTTKQSIEQVMKGHVLSKGELVGVYNKNLE